MMYNVLLLLLVVAFFTNASSNASSNDEKERFGLWQRGINDVDGLSFYKIGMIPQIMKYRGGDGGCSPETLTCTQRVDLGALKLKFGEDFTAALKLNEVEHRRDCDKSCEKFYCGDGVGEEGKKRGGGLEYDSYSMGTVPPEDFANEFKVRERV